MKKVYSAPQSKTIVLDTCSTLLAGSYDSVEVYKKRGNGTQLSNERQGGWDWHVEMDE